MGADIKEIPLSRFVLGLAAVVIAVASCQPAVQLTGTSAASALAFEAKFETRDDFFGRFDYGYSGGAEVGKTFHGDHDMNCGPPTSLRDVTLGGTSQAHVDFSHVFWYCAPGGDATKGHIMTAVDTTGYNIAWFSPKPFFTGVTKVCWDQNMTAMSGRKWNQVLFVSQADATRYPTGTPVQNGGTLSYARGTGGFDLGYTSPEFRDPHGADSGIFPQGGTLAGFKSQTGSAEWFQDQDTWMTRDQGPANIIDAGTDKATRFKHCLENMPGNVVRSTMDTPNGVVVRDLTGQIPQAAVRVVFEDDNYDPIKGDGYNPDVLTWHWDNIQIQAASQELAATPSKAAAPTNDQPAALAPAAGDAPVASPQGVAKSVSARSAGANLGAANLAGLLLTILGLLALLVFGPVRSVGRVRRESRVRQEDPTEVG